MKKSDTETVYCCECRPFRRFDPPNAAAQLREHYDGGKHTSKSYVTGSAVQIDR